MVSPTKPRAFSLRSLLVGIALATLLPVVGFAALLTTRLTAQERAASERRLQLRARGLADALDREMGGTLRTLSALAGSVALDAPVDLAAFHRESVRVARTQGTWRQVRLAGLDGQPLVDTAVSFGVKLPPVDDATSLQHVLSSGEPVVGHVAGGSARGWAYPVRVPVLRDGLMRYVLTVVTSTDAIAQVVSGGERAEDDWSRSVVDEQGIIVARTRDPGRFVGKMASAEFLQRTRGGVEGVYRTISADGVDAYVAWRRAALSGWITTVVVPWDVVEAPVRRVRWAAFGLGLGLLFLSAGAALMFGLRMSRTITSVAVAADVLARGEHPKVPRSRVIEVQRLGEALEITADLVAQRERERDENLARAEAARRQAEDANRAKDEFLAMLGHELRNPLSPIVTAIELQKRRGGEWTREQRVIERQVRHLVRLVDDLLDIERVTRGKLELKMTDVEVGAAVARAVEMASPIIEAREHALTVEAPTNGLLVRGDGDRLAQVVANLLTNAAKYTPPRGRIEVRAEGVDDEVRISVTDNGKGIDDDLLPRVFDLFVQGPRSLDRQEGGLGIGLTLVRSLVRAHGGEVRAHSNGSTKGSSFVVTLPRAADTGNQRAMSSTAVPAHPTRRARLLVVDDNLDAAALLLDLLRGAGHEVVVAHDGPSALLALDAFAPDVAFLDIGLPVMDGYELAARIRQRLGERAPAFVALTGYAQATDRARSSAAGFLRHFVKPADAVLLLATVEELTYVDRLPS